jgi:hypothetical protein
LPGDAVNIINKPAGDYLRMLKDQVPFSFSRYWDGEIHCIIRQKLPDGKLGKNCDDCLYTDDLRDGLVKSITNAKPYYHAIHWPTEHMGTVNLRAQFEQWLSDIGSKIEWYDFLVWQRMIENGTFRVVTKILDERKCFFIAGEHLLQSVRLITDSMFYAIPKTDAIERKEDIKKFIHGTCDLIEKPVFLFAAGMASNVIIDELYDVCPTATMIDMGTVWDALCGLKTRKWIRMIPEDVLRRNF